VPARSSSSHLISPQQVCAMCVVTIQRYFLLIFPFVEDMSLDFDVLAIQVKTEKKSAKGEGCADGPLISP
jgi:hypothetical protein